MLEKADNNELRNIKRDVSLIRRTSQVSNKFILQKLFHYKKNTKNLYELEKLSLTGSPIKRPTFKPHIVNNNYLQIKFQSKNLNDNLNLRRNQDYFVNNKCNLDTSPINENSKKLLEITFC